MTGIASVATPIDDNNTAHWWVACYPRLEGEAGQEPEDIPVYYPIVPELTPEGQPKWDILDTNSAQDPAAWITQGAIADRTQEHLGRSDKGIILYRQMLEDNIKKVELVAFEELGMEAIRKIQVVDFPAFIVVDDKGNDFFR